jgi:hypothetical protein
VAGQVFHGLLARANPPMQLAEAEMAVGDERAHAARLVGCSALLMLLTRWVLSDHDSSLRVMVRVAP